MDRIYEPCFIGVGFILVLLYSCQLYSTLDNGSEVVVVVMVVIKICAQDESIQNEKFYDVRLVAEYADVDEQICICLVYVYVYFIV